MKTKIYVIYYSMYGHVKKLAHEVLKGANSVEGVEASLWQVPETLPQEVLDKMHAPPKDPEVPIIDVHKLPEADGYLFGFPTRYGCMAAQFKAFFDATGQLWMQQGLAGKTCGFFFSSAGQGGGQETTVLTSLPNIINHGMLFIPLANSFGPRMSTLEELRGGSPYGAGTYAGLDGSRQPTPLELEIACHQGKLIPGENTGFTGDADKPAGWGRPVCRAGG
ncbi:unnamed protein product [Calypogeia fissa]